MIGKVMLAGIAGLMLVSGAQASKWVLLEVTGKRPIRTLTWIDRENFRITSAGSTAWMLVVLENRAGPFRLIYTLAEFDCGNRKIKMTPKLWEKWDGTRNFGREEGAWTDVVPDTSGERYLKKACEMPPYDEPSTDKPLIISDEILKVTGRRSKP